MTGRENSDNLAAFMPDGTVLTPGGVTASGIGRRMPSHRAQVVLALALVAGVLLIAAGFWMNAILDLDATFGDLAVPLREGRTRPAPLTSSRAPVLSP